MMSTGGHGQLDHGAEPGRVFTADLPTVVAFAGASGDLNPIHFDREAARAAGHADYILHGLLMAGWLAEVAVDEMGGAWRIEEFEVSYRRPNLVGVPFIAERTREEVGPAAVVELCGGGDSERPATVGRARFGRFDDYAALGR